MAPTSTIVRTKEGSYISHVAAVNILVKDLDVLKTAGEALGFEFMEGQRTHRWYGRFLDDWNSSRAASKKGFNPATFGTCDHALRMKAQPTGYEIGVTAKDDGTYDIVYDSFGSGHQIEKLAGIDLVRLKDEVGAEVATRRLKREGYRVSRQESEGARVVLLAQR